MTLKDNMNACVQELLDYYEEINHSINNMPYTQDEIETLRTLQEWCGDKAYCICTCAQTLAEQETETLTDDGVPF